MKTVTIPQSPAAARALARALRDDGPEAFLRLAEEQSLNQPDALLEPLEAALEAEPAMEEAFPAMDFSLVLDADPEEFEAPQRCLALAICLSPALWRLGAEFGSEQGERARDLFSRLCQAQLNDPRWRDELLRQGLGGGLWSSSPRARLAVSGDIPEGLELSDAELSLSFWRQARLLGMIDPYAADIEPEFEEDDPMSAFELIALASGCPPREEEAAWALRALGGEAGLRAGLGPLWAHRLAEIAAETLNAPALELASGALNRNDVLARALWPALAEACELSSEFIEEASQGIDSDESPARVERLKAEALDEIRLAAIRCAKAASPCGPPTGAELRQFPSGLQEAIGEASAGSPSTPDEPTAGARVIALDFRKKK